MTKNIDLNLFIVKMLCTAPSGKFWFDQVAIVMLNFKSAGQFSKEPHRILYDSIFSGHPKLRIYRDSVTLPLFDGLIWYASEIFLIEKIKVSLDAIDWRKHAAEYSMGKLISWAVPQPSFVLFAPVWTAQSWPLYKTTRLWSCDHYRFSGCAPFSG